MQRPIRNIIFDLGNVLIHCDFAYASHEMSLQSDRPEQDIMHALLDNPLLDDFDAGKYSAEEFVEHIRQLAGWRGTSEELETIWNTMLTPDEMMFDYMDALIERGYRSYILSNINPYHISHVKETYPRVMMTHGQVFSCECGLIKPSEDIFHHTRNALGLEPTETIFVDDRIDNIRAAERLGFVGIVHRGYGDTRRKIEELLARGH